jgi:hypothetical protein
LLHSSQDPGLVPLSDFATNTSLYKRDLGGLEEALGDDERIDQHVVYHKFVGRGYIMHLQTQPLFDDSFFAWFSNAMLLAMSKQVIFDTSFIGAPVPALEANIIVGVTFKLTNLYSLPLTGVQLLFK